MKYHNILAIFEHTLDHSERMSTGLRESLLKLAHQELVERISALVGGAIASAQRVWMTSDLHIGHTNIISYAERPFGNLASMNQALEALLSKVGPDELIVFVGDMIMGDYDGGVELLRRLPGRKVLVAGNHDFTQHGKLRLRQERTTDGKALLFEAVVPFLFWPGSLGSTVLVCHYPVVAPNKLKAPIVNYHGHLHLKTLPSTETVKYINVGWDVTHGLVCL